MGTLAMTQSEREQFLSELHVGVLGIERPDGPPLTVPVWYVYEPGGELWFLISPDSVKGRLLEKSITLFPYTTLFRFDRKSVV